MCPTARRHRRLTLTVAPEGVWRLRPSCVGLGERYGDAWQPRKSKVCFVLEVRGQSCLVRRQSRNIDVLFSRIKLRMATVADKETPSAPAWYLYKQPWFFVLFAAQSRHNGRAPPRSFCNCPKSPVKFTTQPGGVFSNPLGVEPLGAENHKVVAEYRPSTVSKGLPRCH